MMEVSFKEEGEMMSGNDKSMFGMMQKHDIKLEQHEDILEDHGIQLKIQAEQIKQLQDNGIRLENIVMSENRETRLTITNTNQKLHELINGLMGYKTGQSQLSNTLKMSRWESIAKIVGILAGVLAGSGGILYWIFGQ